MSSVQTFEALLRARVIPVLRLASHDATTVAIECLMEAGFSTVEVTLTTPAAIEILRELRRRVDEAFLVGAGTVLDLETAKHCVDAGADYLVSPCAVAGIGTSTRPVDSRG